MLSNFEWEKITYSDADESAKKKSLTDDLINISISVQDCCLRVLSAPTHILPMFANKREQHIEMI